jgi:hypothetical protein
MESLGIAIGAPVDPPQMFLQDLRDGDLTISSVHVGLVSHPDEERHPVCDDPTMGQRVRVVELVADELRRLPDSVHGQLKVAKRSQYVGLEPTNGTRGQPRRSGVTAWTNGAFPRSRSQTSRLSGVPR